MKDLFVNKARNEAYDIARGIGILLMVMGHTGFGTEFDKIIHTFHMPLFFFISGYFFRPEKNNSFTSYLLHQIRVLLIPYLCFAVFYSVLHYIYTGDFSIRYFFLSLASPNHNRIEVTGALWFLMCLFVAKIIYYILVKSIKSLAALTILIVIVAIMSMTLRQVLHIKLWLCIDSAMSMLIIVHLGYLMFKYKSIKYIKKISDISWWGVIPVAAVFFISGFWNGHVNIRCNWYNNFVLYAVSCISGILLTIILSHKLDKVGHVILYKVKCILTFWGRESIVFLLINELFLFIVSESFIIIGASREFVAANYWMRGLVVLGAMGLMSVVALISREPPLAFIFGKTALYNHKKTNS